MDRPPGAVLRSRAENNHAHPHAAKSLVRLAREHETWARKVLARAEEQAERGLLAEGKRGIPVRVAGVNINCLGGIDPFNPGPFGFPGAGSRATGQIEGGGGICEGRLRHQVRLARTAGSKGHVSDGQGGVRPSAGLRFPPGQKDQRRKVRCAPGEDIDRMHGDGGKVLPIQWGKLCAQFQEQCERLAAHGW